MCNSLLSDCSDRMLYVIFQIVQERTRNLTLTNLSRVDL